MYTPRCTLRRIPVRMRRRSARPDQPDSRTCLRVTTPPCRRARAHTARSASMVMGCLGCVGCVGCVGCGNTRDAGIPGTREYPGRGNTQDAGGRRISLGARGSVPRTVSHRRGRHHGKRGQAVTGIRKVLARALWRALDAALVGALVAGPGSDVGRGPWWGPRSRALWRPRSRLGRGPRSRLGRGRWVEAERGPDGARGVERWGLRRACPRGVPQGGSEEPWDWGHESVNGGIRKRRWQRSIGNRHPSCQPTSHPRCDWQNRLS